MRQLYSLWEFNRLFVMRSAHDLLYILHKDAINDIIVILKMKEMTMHHDISLTCSSLFINYKCNVLILKDKQW